MAPGNIAGQPKACRVETDSCDTLKIFVLMHVVVPKPLRSFGRHALEPVDHQTVDHGGQMQAGTGDDEAVPQRIVEAKALPGEEDDAAGVDDAAGDDQRDRRCR